MNHAFSQPRVTMMCKVRSVDCYRDTSLRIQLSPWWRPRGCPGRGGHGPLVEKDCSEPSSWISLHGSFKFSILCVHAE